MYISAASLLAIHAQLDLFSSFASFKQLLKYAKPWRFKIYLATLYSILNKLFDIAPEILIGVAVDLVVQKEDSIIASLGFESIQSHELIGVIIILTGVFIMNYKRV